MSLRMLQYSVTLLFLLVSYLHNEFRSCFTKKKTNEKIFTVKTCSLMKPRDSTFAHWRSKNLHWETLFSIFLEIITWILRVEVRATFYPTSPTSALSKRESRNCEPRSEALASRLAARTRIIVVLWWAPDTSLLSLRESWLPLGSCRFTLLASTKFCTIDRYMLFYRIFPRYASKILRIRLTNFRKRNESLLLSSRFVFSLSRWILMIRVVIRDTSVLSISSCRIEVRIVKRNFQSENSRRRCSRGTKFPGETPELFFLSRL